MLIYIQFYLNDIIILIKTILVQNHNYKTNKFRDNFTERKKISVSKYLLI